MTRREANGIILNKDFLVFYNSVQIYCQTLYTGIFIESSVILNPRLNQHHMFSRCFLTSFFNLTRFRIYKVISRNPTQTNATFQACPGNLDSFPVGWPGLSVTEEMLKNTRNRQETKIKRMTWF